MARRLIESAMQRLREWGARRAYRALYVECGLVPAGLGAYGRGLAPAQELAAALRAPHKVDLLRLRLTALGLDADALGRSDPELMRDMRARCRLCDAKGSCTWDLAHDPAGGSWRRYCENASALQTLAA